jgi:hypothetical protein
MTKFPLRSVIGVGFGHSAVCRDGVPVWTDPEPQDGGFMTVADAEAMASADPDHDWRIVLHGPLRHETYQRHAPCVWSLIESGDRA